MKNKQKQLLIVEDDISICKILEKRLSPFFSLEISYDGKDAWNKIEENPPQLLLLDIQLPDINGLEILKRIRKQNLEIAVVVMTAYGSESTAVEVMKLGADDYLTKPLTFRTIKYTLEKSIEKLYLKQEKAYLLEQLQLANLELYEKHETLQEMHIELLDAQGQITQYNEHLETLLKERESELVASEQKYRNLIEYASDAILLIDTKKHFQLVNKQTEVLLGYTRKQLFKMRIDEIFPDAELTNVAQAIKKVLEDDNISLEIPIKRSDDTQFIGDINIVSIKRENQIIGIQFIIRDITEHKQFIENLERSHKELEEIAEMKNKFLALASHELQTPLVSLGLCCDYLKRYIEDKELKRILEIAKKNVNRLDELIKELLNLTHLRSGKVKMKFVLLSLGEVIREIVDEIEIFCRERNLQIQIDNLDNLPNIYGDKRYLYTVFMNLLTNAIKYTPDGGQIYIYPYRISDGEIEIAITDTGIGIPAEEQDKIFTPFYEVEKPTYHTTSKTKFKGGGLGVGLALVKNILEAHQGRIRLISEGQERGTTFYVCLPIISKII